MPSSRRKRAAAGNESRKVASKKGRNKQEDIKKWFENSSSEEKILDRWFKSESNFGGGRFNIRGDWIGEFWEKVDWDDFVQCLDEVPALSEVAEGFYPPIPITQHCCYVADPPVPASVIKKLIANNRSLLEFKHGHVADQSVIGGERSNVSLLMLYLDVASFPLYSDPWEPDFEVAKMLIEAEPKLLFYHDSEGNNGKQSLLWQFPEKGKAYLKELGKKIDLEALENEVNAEEERKKEEDEDDSTFSGDEILGQRVAVDLGEHAEVEGRITEYNAKIDDADVVMRKYCITLGNGDEIWLDMAKAKAEGRVAFLDVDL